MVNLVRALVDQGVLTPEKGKVLMAQAEAEAARARSAQAAAAAAPAVPAVPNQQVASGELTPPPAGAVRVPYVPETVRAQIRDEIRNDVLAQAKTEGWASPGKAAPEWISNVQIHGDFASARPRPSMAATTPPASIPTCRRSTEPAPMT